jgi:hypothetical protein
VKKQVKHYRIVTENGDSLLIRRESLHCLLQSLELLANARQRPVQVRAPMQTKK